MKETEKEEQYRRQHWLMVGAVIAELAVDGPLRSMLRSRAVDDEAGASSERELNVADSDPCWSNPGAAGPGPGGSWIGRAGMSMCRRLMAGLNRSSLRSIGLSLTLMTKNNNKTGTILHANTSLYHANESIARRRNFVNTLKSVSYTHLTLPTNREV